MIRTNLHTCIPEHTFRLTAHPDTPALVDVCVLSPEATVTEVLEAFDGFLRAATYNPEGKLEYNPEGSSEE